MLPLLLTVSASLRSSLIVPRETNMCNERESSGLICQGCSLLARCVRIRGDWETIPVETCSNEDGYYCNVKMGGCSNQTGPCHPINIKSNFACTSEGVFPNPYDCQRYYMCYNAIKSTLVAVHVECGGKRAFSAATGDCSLTLDDDVCATKQYSCDNAGDSQAWPGNSNVFYICKADFDQGHRILYPALYRCAWGEVFNGQDCVRKAEHHIHPASIPAANSISSSTLPLMTQSDSEFVCHYRGLYSDPNDCHSYYYCDSGLSPTRYTCPKGTHFNDRTKSCIRGDC